jgi:radical SAM protein with 4Fe4S-binding SPASM domain
VAEKVFMRKAPDYIQFYPTLRCNRSCDFCFNKSMPFQEDMSIGDFRAMLGRLRHIGVKTIDIIGGEPTLHKDLFTMVHEAGKAGFGVNVSSNGADAGTLARILTTTGKTTVGISINDRETLARLTEFIKKHGPVVKTVYNAGMDEGLVKAIRELRPKDFFLLYRDAVSGEELDATVPFDRFLKTVKEKFDVAAKGTVFCSGFLPDAETYPELSKTRCPAGTTKLGVMPDGSVYPCNLFFGREEFLLGNVLSDPFGKIWDHRTLTFFRSFTGSACPRTSCELHAKCHGGCPAHSLIHHRKLSAPEPRCTRGAQS